MRDIERCRETYRRMYRAMIAKDADVLQGPAVHGTTAQNDPDATTKAVGDWLGTLND